MLGDVSAAPPSSRPQRPSCRRERRDEDHAPGENRRRGPDGGRQDHAQNKQCQDEGRPPEEHQALKVKQ